MKEILVNHCYGGFGFSKAFVNYIRMEDSWDIERAFDRDDPELIRLVKAFGLDKASGSCAKLAIVEIPDNATDWEIDEYDGAEGIIAVVDGKIVHY